MNHRIIPYSPHLKKYAKILRENMTFSEVKFWKWVRNFQLMGYDFDRQKPILQFIVDFYCADLKLIVEIDGITHEDPLIAHNDLLRDQEFNKYKLTIIRFSARNIVFDFENVKRTVINYIDEFEEKNNVPERVLKRRGKY